MAHHNESCWVCLLRSTIIDIHRYNDKSGDGGGTRRTASALHIALKISELCSNMVMGAQQDPSEFLIILLDKVMECLSSTVSSCHTRYLSSIIHSFIGVNIKTSIRCEQCLTGGQNETCESLLSVPIASHSSVCAAISAFCADERLFDDNAFDCSRCQRGVEAWRTVKLANIAPIMLIHLKRFTFDNRLRTTVKLKHFVKYQEVIDMTPFMDQNAAQQRNMQHKNQHSIYRLFAVLVHLGESAANGHVFAYVLAPDNNWYKANDEIVTPVPLDVVLNDRNAYILCYGQTMNTRPLRDTSQQKRCDSKSSSLYSSTPKCVRDEPNHMVSDYSPVRVALEHKTFARIYFILSDCIR